MMVSRLRKFLNKLQFLFSINHYLSLKGASRRSKTGKLCKREIWEISDTYRYLHWIISIP